MTSMGDKDRLHRENEALRWENSSLREHAQEQKEELRRLREMHQDDSVKAERIIQSGTEYVKAQYEYFKQFTTIALVSITVLGALLVGFSKGSSRATSGDAFAVLPAIDPMLFDWTRTIVTLLAFAGFIVSGLGAVEGMHQAKNALWTLGISEQTSGRLRDKVDGIGRKLDRTRKVWITYIYGIGLAAFVAFVLLNVLFRSSTP